MPISHEKRLAVEMARRAILQQWRQRDMSADVDVTSEMYNFYDWLRQARPGLLDFDCQGLEPWHLIQSWLESYEQSHPRM